MRGGNAKAGAIREVSVDSPLNHGRYLHGTNEGDVTVAQKFPGLPSPLDWQPHCYSTRKLYEVLPAYGGSDDTYISQNRFWGPRAISRLAQLSAMYTDIDYYNVPGLAGAHPRGILDFAFEALQQARIPHPSLAVSTGRGLALVWRHEPVPRTVLPKWDLCQDYIFRALKGLGADPSARDAARVLRLIGTRNSKSGTIVEAIWEEPGEATWNFSDLADEILPLSREELEVVRARGRKSKKGTSKDTRRRVSKSPDNLEKGLTVATLALGRLSDLQLLLRLRGLDKLPPGQRDSWMFAAGTSLAFLTESRFLERELIVLGRNHAGWSEAETRSRMQAVIARAQAANDGATVEWNGQQRDPRYRLTNRKIIEMLDITPGEEKKMSVLISTDTKRQRDRERKERERRARGAKPREEYLAEAKEKQLLAQGLRDQGMSLRKIGQRLGIAHTHVRRLIAPDQ